ncbi:Uncharacterised protein [Klebsiella pneumoniae]|uniref:Uncharacterized protein n=1 Tax=Klebsiella pneumoniae TaxID=573 RepID=A0A2X1QQD8_KLEPN|nr:Uncharacterised protein [Klebsiella pneumoniae]
MDPRLGANGKLPRQDISSRVTGPILEHLHHNFAMAWEKETGQDLLTIRDSVSIAKKAETACATRYAGDGATVAYSGAGRKA